MEKLPKHKQMSPLQELVIPGTHDSCSFSVSVDNDLSPSEPKWMKLLVKIFGKLAKWVIYRWSKTQELDLGQQLIRGCRYIDMRVALNPTNGDFQTVHGLYGGRIRNLLQPVKAFVTDHPKEVVILDFNHFYNMDASAHQKLSGVIKGLFGDRLLPPGKIGVQMTLNDAWDMGKNVIVTYDYSDVIEDNPEFWSGSDIYSPWANTSKLATLINFLNTETESHSLPKGSFHIAQGLLSPNTKVLLAHLTSSLKATLALKATQGITSWLKSVALSNAHTFNIIIADFVDYDEFAETVVGMNAVQDAVKVHYSIAICEQINKVI
ncbi:predicted protein [Nematostella vectensis]|uniref:Phosphatidylinositol-specific phospholipase C X domain-containing protein n=2 Tax=Nematostella vectensis TaxID=45351 RepID=A7RYL5_NEMVE|nr:predicted protein [Nematostella vectensis]|eukprot:XP_001635605.1 predicted protein [Nematostella vectensis]